MSGAKPFEKGCAKTGGRVKGSRNLLSKRFVEALCQAFEERGEEAIRICIDENPEQFLKIIAAVLPKEFEITDSRLKEIPDAELDAFIAFAKRHLAGAVGEPDDGEGPTLN